MLGPQYDGLKAYWDNPTAEAKARLGDAITEEGYREEILNGSVGEVGARIPPDMWRLHWALTDERRKAIYLELIAGLKDNRNWFPRYQAYLRDHQPPALILWGPRDGYMPAPSAEAYRRDLPNAELHLFDDAGHWLLETHLDQAVPLMRDFLRRL